MASENKRDFWRRHIEGWRQSKLSQKTYCQQQGISFASFGYWRARLKRQTESGGKLIPVNIAKASSSVTVFLPLGVRLEIPAHTLAEVLPVIVCSVQETS